jgi:hypothetical protein
MPPDARAERPARQLNEGWRVRALSRDSRKKKARRLAAIGADVVRADMFDPLRSIGPWSGFQEKEDEVRRRTSANFSIQTVIGLGFGLLIVAVLIAALVALMKYIRS